MVCESLVEFSSSLMAWYFQPESDAKDAAKTKLMAEVRPAFIKAQNRILAANGNNGYYFGDETTLADVILFSYIYSWNAYVPWVFEREAVPEMYKVHDRVAKNPRIIEYLASPRLHPLQRS
ncbi:glutathione S-transferase [Blastocladiella britannica]|nr:glutathione S-transferase [Blastocladiella britannica]